MPETPERRLAAILAADMVGYSQLIERDEVGTVARLKADRDALIDPTIAAHGGRIVRLAGDGALVEFPSVVEATQCAIDIQRAMPTRNAERPVDQHIVFRMGVNLGDIIVEEDNLHGEGINIAARLESLAEPGTILVSERVAELVDGKIDASLVFVGERTVKNIERPVRVWCVDPDGKPNRTQQSRPSRVHRGLATAGIGLLLGVGVIAIMLFLGRIPSTDPPHAERPILAPAKRASLAVLPFENISADEGQEYFADGITDDLINNLSQISALLVISRHAAFAYKGRTVPVAKIRDELGVRYLLEGSVRRSGGRIRINAQLIDSLTGEALWAERYDRQFADIFDVQDDVTTRITAALELELTEQDQQILTNRYTENPDAYDYFLRGQEHYFRLTEQDNAQASDFYRRAIELDPRFARAYGALAVTYARHVYYGWAHSPEHTLKEAIRLARGAVALDEQLPQAHWALGFVYLLDRQYDAAIRSTERVLELAPNNVEGYGLLAWIYTFAGRPNLGIEFIDRAVELEPEPTALLLSVLGEAQYHAGEFDRAVITLEKVLERNPNLVDSRINLVASYYRLGKQGDAEWQILELLNSNPNFSIQEWVRRTPIREPETLERLVADLKAAGLQ